MKILDNFKNNWFLVGMVIAILLATISADIGRSGGIIHLDKLTGIGVAIVFFLHGLGLSPSAIKSGISNWRMHIYIQLATFVIYPLLWVIFGDLLLTYMPAALAFGFCYLLVLPSTVSSSVAMTSVAKGNVPAAIFNASLSTMLGVLITPLLIQLFMGLEDAKLDLMTSIISITKLLLLPMIFGQILRPLLRSFIEKHKAIVNKVDKYVILLIVYNAFCNSVANGIWHSFSIKMLVSSIIICVLLLLIMVNLVRWGSQQCQFGLADEVTTVFCGTKKTLVAGIPMANAIFANDPHLGMILLPVMLYHPIQIFYCAVLANRYAKRIDKIAEDLQLQQNQLEITKQQAQF
ncbi:bile acid:sodium symporter family protein [Psychromonas algicola]|uniref:bile acid:sodium symporter family protein n=1 Tax=Psychromonas algicola TaxID=2555642 RepID=UPI001068A2D2|nr:bile acid:sodium symporter family protein [Psychromonas sp. RZ5]TEW50211.1 bile acid:sodium symporter [Psychromonas sp. RZ5]